MSKTVHPLISKGIIKPSGEIGKDKINLVAGAITQPFAEMVWVIITTSKLVVCTAPIREPTGSPPERRH